MLHTARHAAIALLAMVALSQSASACPYCSLSQGSDTLMYVVSFLVIPYVIVGGTWVWMKRVLNSENEA
jgi:hypothetical protein